MAATRHERRTAAHLEAHFGIAELLHCRLIAETTPEGLLLRPAVTLPVEIYTQERVRELDAAEAELAKALRFAGR